MPTPTKGRRLGGSPSHEKLMMANLATSLFEHGRITTTEAKAKRVRPLAEKLITKAKNGDLHNRRQIQKVIRDKSVVHKLMAEIGPFYEDRNGGYTRITRTPPRQGDNAAMAVIELVSEKTVTSEAEKARGTKFAKDQPADDAKAAGHAGADAALAEPVGDAGAAEESDGESAPEADASESDATVAEDTSSEESEEGENKKDES